MTIDGVEVKGAGFDREELSRYVAYVKEREPDVVSLRVTLGDYEGVDLAWTAHHTKFERIRRITGYLVGTIDRWNDAKQAEEHDRLKHS